MSDAPKIAWTGVLKVFGVSAHCYIFEDGRRAVEGAGLVRIIGAMGKKHLNPQGELHKITNFVNGSYFP